MVPNLGILYKSLGLWLWLHNTQTKLREANTAVQIIGCKKKEKKKKKKDSVDLKKKYNFMSSKEQKVLIMTRMTV